MTNPTNENSDLERKLIPMVTEIEPVKQGRLLVVVIGINEYVHWQKLKNAVQDAVGIQQTLIDKLGFTAPSFSPLLDSAATKKAIEFLIEDQLRNFLEENDSLILFFAGHGSTRVDRAGGKTTGFLVPVEADKYWSNYIKIEPFLEAVGSLPARHILVILDSCFSGIALGRAMSQHRDAIQYTEDLGKRISRKVITSARYEQTALDGGPIPGHSLFTGTLIDGLNWGKADTDTNGFITSFELGHFLQSQVGNQSHHKQTPDYGTFCDDIDERGEMIISLRDQSFDQIKARSFSALQSGKFTIFKELVEQLTLLKPSSPETLYLEYRLMVIEGNFEKANVIIKRLSQLNLVEGTIPLSKNALCDELRHNLPYWLPVLQINEIESNIEFTVLTGINSVSLEPVYEQAIGEVQGYSISNKAIFQVSLKNITNFPVYAYAIQITPSGLLDSVILLKSQAMLNGLMPGTIELTYPFTPGQEPGIGEIRLFTSFQKLEWFMFTPKPGAKDYLPPIDVNEIKNMKMRSITYRVETNI